jgi:hypothetical protein
METITKTIRCAECKHKALFGFRCTCGLELCLEHRYREMHQCTKIEDMKKIEIEALSKRNPAIKKKIISRV